MTNNIVPQEIWNEGLELELDWIYNHTPEAG